MLNRVSLTSSLFTHERINPDVGSIKHCGSIGTIRLPDYLAEADYSSLVESAAARQPSDRPLRSIARDNLLLYCLTGTEHILAHFGS